MLKFGSHLNFSGLVLNFLSQTLTLTYGSSFQVPNLNFTGPVLIRSGSKP